jgi:hypothetical protein
VSRAVHYKKGKQLGEGFYIIEISSSKDALYISAFNIECAQTLVMEIRQPQAREYLQKFEFDFEQIAQCLRVEENGAKLVLLNPFFQTIQLKAFDDDS